MKAVLALIALAAMLASSEAVTCYVCSGSTCADKYEPVSSHELDCSVTGDYCYKEKSIIKILGTKTTTVSRSCASTANDNANCKKALKAGSSTLGGESWMCTCTESKCNGSTAVTASVGLLAACVSKLFF